MFHSSKQSHASHLSWLIHQVFRNLLLSEHQLDQVYQSKNFLQIFWVLSQFKWVSSQVHLKLCLYSTKWYYLGVLRWLWELFIIHKVLGYTLIVKGKWSGWIEGYKVQDFDTENWKYVESSAKTKTFPLVSFSFHEWTL